MTWKPQPPSKQIGDATVSYLRSPTSSEGGHEVGFGDGRRVWVLPDGRTSGQKRSRLIVAALTELHTGQLDPVAYLRARLHGVGEITDPETAPEPPPPPVRERSSRRPAERQCRRCKTRWSRGWTYTAGGDAVCDDCTVTEGAG